MVREYQSQIVRMILTLVTLVPLAQKEEPAKLGGYPLEPKGETARSRCPLGGMDSMKRSLLIFAVLIATGTARVQPAAAQNRYDVRSTGGLSSVLDLCSLLGCKEQYGNCGSDRYWRGSLPPGSQAGPSDRLRFHSQSVRRLRMARSFLHRHKRHHFTECPAGEGATIQRGDPRSILGRDSGRFALCRLRPRHHDFRTRPPGRAKG